MHQNGGKLEISMMLDAREIRSKGFFDNSVSGPLDRLIRGDQSHSPQVGGSHLKPRQNHVWTGPTQELIGREWEAIKAIKNELRTN